MEVLDVASSGFALAQPNCYGQWDTELVDGIDLFPSNKNKK